jgi:protease-4
VGVIQITYPIGYEYAEIILDQIQEVREDRRIQAAVVQIDSPGGGVVSTQVIYRELQNLRREIPVVGSIDHMADSGAYYAAVATEPIYAKPSSEVGNVGVWSSVPQDLPIDDYVLASGPFKRTATNYAVFVRELEGLKQEFMETVFSQRGERLKLTYAELSQGLDYRGREAARLGLIDHVGNLSEAIATAAEQAGLANYRVVDDIQARAIERWFEENYSLGTQPSATASTARERTLPTASLEGRLLVLETWPIVTDPVTGKQSLPPGIYLLDYTRLRGAP